MNLFDYLNATVTPLSERKATAQEQPQTVGKRRNRNREPNPETNNEARHLRSLAKYRSALGNEWHTSAELVALTKSPKARTMMTRWYDKRLVERRDAITKRDNSRYEWRMK